MLRRLVAATLVALGSMLHACTGADSDTNTPPLDAASGGFAAFGGSGGGGCGHPCPAAPPLVGDFCDYYGPCSWETACGTLTCYCGHFECGMTATWENCTGSTLCNPDAGDSSSDASSDTVSDAASIDDVLSEPEPSVDSRPDGDVSND